MPRGRPPTPKPGPDSYSSNRYESFLHRIDDNTGELNTIQADRRELIKAETQQGLNRKAHQFVQSLRTAVRNDKMTQQDAVATLDCTQVYAEWSGLTAQRDFFRQEEDAAPKRESGKAPGRARSKKANGGGADEALDRAKQHLGTAEGSEGARPFSD